MAHVISADEVKKSLKLKYGHAIYPDGARKVKFGHVIDEDVNGAKLARKFYSSEITATYTGAHTISQITGTDGALYNLYTLTGSGILTVSDAVQVWLCGGGGSGGSATGMFDLKGGGAGAYAENGNIDAGEYVITIGSTAGTTKIGSLFTAKGGSNATDGNGASGGTGGGAAFTSYKPGTGDGVSKYPFGITSLKAHCAGGGAGSRNTKVGTSSGDRYYGTKGGSGGTNGGSGGAATQIANATNSWLTTPVPGGAGGSYGGGKGGQADTGKGNAATFYGAGGGGGGGGYKTTSGTFYGAGGSGYQGVAYILIPA